MTTPQPTPAELAILRVLWQRGPSTVREVHDAMDRTDPVGYTTVLKMLQIMTDKRLVSRDETQRAPEPHICWAERHQQRDAAHPY